MLALLIEAGGDGVPFFEHDEKGWQRRSVVNPGFGKVLSVVSDARKLLDDLQMPDPGCELSLAVAFEQPAIPKPPKPRLALQAIANALGQSFLDFGKLVLMAIRLIVGGCSSGGGESPASWNGPGRSFPCGCGSCGPRHTGPGSSLACQYGIEIIA